MQNTMPDRWLDSVPNPENETLEIFYRMVKGEGMLVFKTGQKEVVVSLSSLGEMLYALQDIQSHYYPATPKAGTDPNQLTLF